MKKLLLALIFILGTTSVFATHGQGGDITYEYVSQNTYIVRLIIFRDCHGVALGTTAAINISSISGGTNQNYTLTRVGVGLDITPLCSSQVSRCASATSTNEGVEQHLYQATITLPSTRSDYKISYTLCCRNNAITTLNSPGAQNIYVEALLNSSIANSSPVFNNSPVAFFCNGQQINYNHGVSDRNGDELFFSLVAPLEGANNPVNYLAGFSGTVPLTTTGPFTIDSSTGAISFIPNGIQTAVLGVKVEEFRFIGGIRTKIGEVLRDMQFSIEDCSVASSGGTANNAPPVVSGINGTASISGVTGSYTTTGVPGVPINFNLVAFDQITSNLILTWNNGISGATFTPNGTGTGATFSWTPTINDGGTNFFTVTVKDDNCPLLGINVYTFKIIVDVPVSVTCPSAINDTFVGCSKQISYTSSATGSPAPVVTYAFTGATTASGNGDGSGSFFNNGTTTVQLTATDGGGLTAFCSFNVTIGGPITFTAPTDLCINAGLQTGLGGGTSNGGVYSGAGVTNNGNGMTYTFDPATAGVGVHTLTYTGCVGSATDTIEVFALPTDNTVSELTTGVLTANNAVANYQWYQCPNTLIAGATSQNYTPTVLGDYKVVIRNGACTIESICYTLTTLGTNDFDTKNFNYYPNPTSNVLNIEYSKTIENISVINLLGQQLFEKKMNNKKIQVDLSLLQTGTYFIKIKAEGKVKTITVVRI
jgi:hypothetical protein